MLYGRSLLIALLRRSSDLIIETDVEDEETVRVPIGNKELAFTAVHLAEIQTIFELEKEEK